jgi:hypothetical protein
MMYTSDLEFLEVWYVEEVKLMTFVRFSHTYTYYNRLYCTPLYSLKCFVCN